MKFTKKNIYDILKCIILKRFKMSDFNGFLLLLLLLCYFDILKNLVIYNIYNI